MRTLLFWCANCGRRLLRPDECLGSQPLAYLVVGQQFILDHHFGTGRPDASASLAILAPAAYPMYRLSAVTTPIELTTQSHKRSALAVMPATHFSISDLLAASRCVNDLNRL